MQGKLDERNSRENHGKQVSLEIERTAIKDNVAWKRFIERSLEIQDSREKTNAIFLPWAIRRTFVPRVWSFACFITCHFVDRPPRSVVAIPTSQRTRSNHPISHRFLGYFMGAYFSDKDVIFLDDRLLLAVELWEACDRPIFGRRVVCLVSVLLVLGKAYYDLMGHVSPTNLKSCLD